jgi:hypothetical protein
MTDKNSSSEKPAKPGEKVVLPIFKTPIIPGRSIFGNTKPSMPQMKFNPARFKTQHKG